MATILHIRSHKRFAVRQHVTLRRPEGQAVEGLLVELSLEGCRITALRNEEYEVGEAALMRIDGLDEMAAAVRWFRTGVVGLRFERPLHIAELERLIEICRETHRPASAVG